MPKLPTITATGRRSLSGREPGILLLPSISRESFGAQVGRELQRTNERFQDIADKLQNEQDRLKTLDAAASFDLEADRHRAAVQVDEPDRRKRATLFADRMKAKAKELTHGATPAVQNALNAHHLSRLAQDIINIDADSLVRMKDENAALLERSKRTLTLLIPTITNPGTRHLRMLEYRGRLDQAVKYGLMKAGEAEQDWTTFTNDVLHGSLITQRRTDPEQMRLDVLSGQYDELDNNLVLTELDNAIRDEDRAQTRKEKAFKRMQDDEEWQWSSRANEGLLTQAELNLALQGKHKFISPEKARAYQRINDDPPLGGNSTVVGAIMLRYHGGPRSQTRIGRARRELNELVKLSGRGSTVLNRALDEIQTDEATLRGVRAAEEANALRRADDFLKSNLDPLLPGTLGTLQKNMQDAARAKMRVRVRELMIDGGLSGREASKVAAEEIVEELKLEVEPVSDDEKLINELVTGEP